MDYQNTSKKEDDSDDGQSNHNPFAAKGAPGQAMPDEGYLDPPPVSQEMSAKDMWERMKQRGDRSDALDRLMALVGLQSVKIQFLKIKTTIEAARRRKGWLRRLDLNMALLGNPGTGKSYPISPTNCLAGKCMLISRPSLRVASGKTTVAKIYHDFLIESKVWPESGSANVSSTLVPDLTDGTLLLWVFFFCSESHISYVLIYPPAENFTRSSHSTTSTRRNLLAGDFFGANPMLRDTFHGFAAGPTTMK